MSFVIDRVAAVDSMLDRLQLSDLPRSPSFGSLESAQVPQDTEKLIHLQSLIKALSTASSPQPSLLSAVYLAKILNDANLSTEYTPIGFDGQGERNSSTIQTANYEHELEWLVLGKATAQVHGLVLSTLLQRTIPVSEEWWYWSDVIGSYQNTGIYSLQTSPVRLWNWSRSIYHEVRQRGGSVGDGWRQFYGLVRKVVRDRSISDLQKRIADPLILVRDEIQKKQVNLSRIKLINATGIGYLLSNGFSDDSMRNGSLSPNKNTKTVTQHYVWKGAVLKSISIMDAVLNVAEDSALGEDDFESAVGSWLNEDPLEDFHQAFLDDSRSRDALLAGMRPSEGIERLCRILEVHLPSYSSYVTTVLKVNGRPSRLIRYWLPASALLLSSSTILRIFVNRKVEIIQWIRDFGATFRDFWYNWVIEPIKRVIGTIRHDESSEVSIMSKRSLEGDRASLERMVVDFATDNPEGGRLSQTEIEDIRAKVHEGDLTPVLRVYEKELSSPLYGSIRGSLIRALLIQIQKTKVDVEVAMGGIDSLLKSQELVFGFVGLTPGILVCVGLYRWFRDAFSNRRQLYRGRNQSQSYQILRNVDRILTSSPQSDAGMLSFKEYGLLVVEAVFLRDIAQKVFPKQVFRQFLQDFNDLIDNSSGVGRQIRVADRIRWAYARWL